jgi:RNA polymerase sigma factor (sigma-70 family)
VAFPETHRSVVAAVRSADRGERTRAFDAIVSAYWQPVRRHLRARFGFPEEDAKDLAQGFFTSMLERETLEQFDPEKGRFRSYLLACLDAFAQNERRRVSRLKRGGGAIHVSLEDSGEEGIVDARSLESEFQREWAKSLFSIAVEALRVRCHGTPKEVAFALLERYDLEGDDTKSYAELAQEYGVSVSQVTNHLSWARRAFREEVLRALRGITASEEEFRSEARILLGADDP